MTRKVEDLDSWCGPDAELQSMPVETDEGIADLDLLLAFRTLRQTGDRRSVVNSALRTSERAAGIRARALEVHREGIE
jgi:hypothetical protein